MYIDRKLNPSLKDLKMMARKKNWIEFVPKGNEETKLDPETLDLLT